MRLTPALLVIVDISGYTDFITNRPVSLQHAEQIITELMESVIDRADHPLAVNKLEGDAALLFRETTAQDAGAAARDVLAQVGGFFTAFDACLSDIRDKRAGCGCEACRHTEKLCLKAFVHFGDIAVKQVRHFEELAGEPVILIHRLLKNSVAEREYVLVTDAVRELAGNALPKLRGHDEIVDSIGPMQVWLAHPADLPALSSPAPRPAAVEPAYQREDTFHHLPARAPDEAAGPPMKNLLPIYLAVLVAAGLSLFVYDRFVLAPRLKAASDAASAEVAAAAQAARVDLAHARVEAQDIASELDASVDRSVADAKAAFDAQAHSEDARRADQAEQVEQMRRKGQAADALGRAGMFKVAVAEHYMTMAAWPSSMQDLGMGQPTDFAGGPVASIRLEPNGVIAIAMKPEVAAGATLRLVPDASPGGMIEWTCRASDYPAAEQLDACAR